MEQAKQLNDLLKRASGGDAAAAELFWREYSPELMRAVRVRMRDPVLRVLHETVDIVQTVIRRYLEHQDAYEFVTIQEFRALMATLIANRIANLQQKYRNELQRAIDKTTIHNQHSSIEGRERMAESVLKAAKECLTPEENELFVAVKIEQQPANIMAERLGKTPEAVRKQVSRILAKVRKHLGLESNNKTD